MVQTRFIRFAGISMLMAWLAPAVASGSDRTAASADSASGTECLPPPASESAAVGPPEPFTRNAIGVEFGLAMFAEAWNLNERREWLAGGSLAIWWAFLDRVSLVVELHAVKVFQQPSRNPFVQGFTPLVRWRIRDAPRWGVFAEAGPGISWSDTEVPPRGTRFNYLLLAGTGVSHRLGARSEAVLGFRWLHVSNNGRKGRHRNPDIEALGPYAGIRIAF